MAVGKRRGHRGCSSRNPLDLKPPEAADSVELQKKCFLKLNDLFAEDNFKTALCTFADQMKISKPQFVSTKLEPDCGEGYFQAEAKITMGMEELTATGVGLKIRAAEQIAARDLLSAISQKIGVTDFSVKYPPAALEIPDVSPADTSRPKQMPEAVSGNYVGAVNVFFRNLIYRRPSIKNLAAASPKKNCYYG